MKIKWLGHSCFLLTSNTGTKIITDPFDQSVGYKLPNIQADIVTSSHNHFDHNYISAVKGKFVHINELGNFKIKDIEINGISTYHDNQKGKLRGHNIVYTFFLDGIHICHCGDLGHLLSDQQINNIGKVDILMVPVGGVYTIDAFQAAKILEQLNPHTIIPMHYKTQALKFELDGVEKFLDLLRNKSISVKKEFDVSLDEDLHSEKVIVLDYK